MHIVLFSQVLEFVKILLILLDSVLLSLLMMVYVSYLPSTNNDPNIRNFVSKQTYTNVDITYDPKCHIACFLYLCRLHDDMFSWYKYLGPVVQN